MKAWSVIGLLFAAAIFATIPISAQVTPRGLELNRWGEGHHLRARPPSQPADGKREFRQERRDVRRGY